MPSYVPGERVERHESGLTGCVCVPSWLTFLVDDRSMGAYWRTGFCETDHALKLAGLLVFRRIFGESQSDTQ